MADRTRHPTTGQEQPIDTAPPPPYTDDDSDISSYESEEPQKLVINAEHRIVGTGNLVSINPSTLADASKFSAILLNAIAQLNAAANSDAGNSDSQARRLCVDLTINCGVSISGSRNVVGNIGLKRKAPIAMPDGGATTAGVVLGAEGAVGGAKRKAGDDGVSLPLRSPSAHLPESEVLTMT